MLTGQRTISLPSNKRGKPKHQCHLLPLNDRDRFALLSKNINAKLQPTTSIPPTKLTTSPKTLVQPTPENEQRQTITIFMGEKKREKREKREGTAETTHHDYHTDTHTHTQLAKFSPTVLVGWTPGRGTTISPEMDGQQVWIGQRLARTGNGELFIFSGVAWVASPRRGDFHLREQFLGKKSEGTPFCVSSTAVSAVYPRSSALFLQPRLSLMEI